MIGLMSFTFARVGAAVQMRVEDVYVQGRRTWVRLHEKGGKVHELPCHHKLDDYLSQYVEKAGLAKDPKERFASMTAFAAALEQASQHAVSSTVRFSTVELC